MLFKKRKPSVEMTEEERLRHEQYIKELTEQNQKTVKTVCTVLWCVAMAAWVILLVLDVLCVFGAFFVGLWVLNDFRFNLALGSVQDYLVFAGCWSLLSVAVFVLCGLYNSIWSFASVDELLHILVSYGISVMVLVCYYLYKLVYDDKIADRFESASKLFFASTIIMGMGEAHKLLHVHYPHPDHK